MKREGTDYPKRLAFFTRRGDVDTGGKFRLEASTEEEIAFIEKCSAEDMEKFDKALDCYESYKEVIEKSNVRELTTNEVAFEVFGEKPESRLRSITDGIE